MFDKVKRALRRQSAGHDGQNSEKSPNFGFRGEPGFDTRPRSSRYAEEDGFTDQQRALRHKSSVENVLDLKAAPRPGSGHSFHAFGNGSSRHPAIHPLDSKPSAWPVRTSTESLVSESRVRSRSSSVSSQKATLPTHALNESSIPKRTTSKRKTGGSHQSARGDSPQQLGANKRYSGPPHAYRHLDVRRDFKSNDVVTQPGEARSLARNEDFSTEDNSKSFRQHVTDRNQEASAHVPQQAHHITTGVDQPVPPSTTHAQDLVTTSITIDHTTHQHPAVTHEHIRPHVHTILQPERTRSFHYHEHRTVIQPIIDPEPQILPEEHFVRDWKTGETFWVPKELGQELDRIGGGERTEVVGVNEVVEAMERVRIRDSDEVRNG